MSIAAKAAALKLKVALLRDYISGGGSRGSVLSADVMDAALDLAEEVHEKGCLACAQVNHGKALAKRCEIGEELHALRREEGP